MIVPKRNNWLAMLFVLRGTALGQIWARLLVTTGVAVGVTVVHYYEGGLPTDITITPFTLIGLALSIFLGFRNNTSYDRFWEGRKLWGRLVNTSRSLCRQIHTLVDTDEEQKRRLVYHLIGYVHALRLHLRNSKDLRDLAPFLPDEKLATLVHELNKPFAVVHSLGVRLRKLYDSGAIHAMHLPILDHSLTDLIDIQGGCERIKSTPIPFSYNVLLHRIVAVYCLGLPFGLVKTVGMFTPLVVLMIAYAFFGLDAVGEQIEEPFGFDANDLPLDKLSAIIESNLRQSLSEKELPEISEAVIQS